jgi:hypothetical protein
MAPAQKKQTALRNIVSERVKAARLRFDAPLTQDQLSGKLALEGVQLDRVAIAKIESGLRCAFDYEVRGLAKILDVDARWLLGIRDGVPPRIPKAAKKKGRA